MAITIPPINPAAYRFDAVGDHVGYLEQLEALFSNAMRDSVRAGKLSLQETGRMLALVDQMQEKVARLPTIDDGATVLLGDPFTNGPALKADLQSCGIAVNTSERSPISSQTTSPDGTVTSTAKHNATAAEMKTALAGSLVSVKDSVEVRRVTDALTGVKTDYTLYRGEGNLTADRATILQALAAREPALRAQYETLLASFGKLADRMGDMIRDARQRLPGLRNKEDERFAEQLAQLKEAIAQDRARRQAEQERTE